jgi:hypothetical protein
MVAALVLAIGCSSTPEELPTAAASVTSQALGLRFAALPAGFEVAEDDARLVLTRDDGTLTVEAGELRDFGIDPVTEANAEQERFEGLVDGVFLGVRQLITPLGPAAYARGRFTDDVAEREETLIFVVHPTANRLITARYLYPAGDDSGARVQTLMELVGEIEAVDRPADTDSPADSPV